MNATIIPIPGNFPVTWRCPEDAQWLWSQDRLHYPDPVTPLEFSLIEEGVDAGLTKAARAYDIPITVHDRHINSYLYVAIEPHALPAAEAAALAQQSEAKLNMAMANLRTTWETIWLPEIQQHLAWWAGFDLAAASLPALRQHLAETEQRWQRVWEIHFLLFVPSMLAISEFADLYTDLFEDAEPFAAYKLLAGFPSKTMESGQQLWALSRRILTTPVVLQIFRQQAVADVIAHLSDCAGGRLFLTELHQYLAVHGQRADKLSLHYPYWVEDPTPVIKNLQNYIQQPDRDLYTEMQQTSQQREQHIAHLRTQLQDYPQPVREQVEFLLQAAQAGAFLKEEHGYWIDYKASYGVRQVLLTIGERLVAAGVLAEKGELFYLHLDEVKALLASNKATRLYNAEVRARIAVRKAQAERFAQVAPPPLLGTLPAGPLPAGPLPAEPPPTDPITQMFRKIEGEAPVVVEASNLIFGNAGSPGVVQGTVKVVHGLGEATKLQPGDILVADTTAPPWTPLFASVGGLITNSGGILSHSAVVAREYGIPAVVGAHMATQRLQDGQRVEVDGNRGIVRVLEPKP